MTPPQWRGWKPEQVLLVSKDDSDEELEWCKSWLVSQGYNGSMVKLMKMEGYYMGVWRG